MASALRTVVLADDFLPEFNASAIPQRRPFATIGTRERHIHPQIRSGYAIIALGGIDGVQFAHHCYLPQRLHEHGSGHEAVAVQQGLDDIHCMRLI
jgi:hypothetical protein